MSSHAFGLVARRKGRLVAPLLTFLLGMAVPVALGAARAEKPVLGPYAKIGVDARFPNALACHHNGEFVLLTYEENTVPIRYGFVTLTGTVQAVPFREALRKLPKPGAQESKAPAGTTAPDKTPDAAQAAGSKSKGEH
jgi:hypothetical protein